MYKKLRVYAGDKHPHEAQVSSSKATKGGVES
jgi:ribosomal protein L13